MVLAPWLPSLQHVSLRVKILTCFSVVSIAVFAGAFSWFKAFTTEKAIKRLQEDVNLTLTGAAQGVDVETLLALYAEGQPNAQGFSDDPRFQSQLAWLDQVHQIEPRGWLYLAVIGKSDTNRRAGAPKVAWGEVEMVYLVDLWAKYDPSKASHFLEADIPSHRALQAIETNTIVSHPSLYSDKWGTWLSAWMPLPENHADVDLVLGMDIEADYIQRLEREISDRVLVSFAVTYGVLFILIYLLSGMLTRNLVRLTSAAENTAAGNYTALSHLPSPTFFQDEMTRLAQVFNVMIENIQLRETLIRQGKQEEDRIRLALQQEKELSDLKSRFISIVSHEFRTPLTVIRTCLELLEQYSHVSTEEKRQKNFRRIRAALRDMSNLLDDVLTVSRAEAGKLTPYPIEFNLDQFCQDLVDELMLTSGARHTFAYTTSACDRIVCLDPKLVRSILLNLLTNAIKYSPAGSRIDFSVTYQGNHVIFQIGDEGIGIPLKDQPYLFEQFHRGHNVGAIRGTGLGLSITKQAVELHQGQIQFRSQEGVGTVFSVRLPLTGSAPQQPLSSHQTPMSSS